MRKSCRYQEWQSGARKRLDAKPPRLNPEAGSSYDRGDGAGGFWLGLQALEGVYTWDWKL